MFIYRMVLFPMTLSDPWSSRHSSTLTQNGTT